MTAAPTEQWRDVVGYEGYYQVSDHGRVRSLPGGYRAGRVLTGGLSQLGYRRHVLCRDGTRRTITTHVLVARAFLGAPPDGTEVCHWNDVHDDNRLANLRYGTKFDNQADRRRNGRARTTKRTCHRGHEWTDENTAHERNGGGLATRRCRTCRAESRAAT